MGNKKVLRRLYLERVILIIPVYGLFGYLWGSNSGAGRYYLSDSVEMLEFILVFVLGSTWYLMKRMRSGREVSFVNALPITKGQQMAALTEVVFLLSILFIVMGEVQLGYFSRLWLAPGEFVLNVSVKTSAVFCAACMLIWLLSHYMLGLGQVFLGSLALAGCYGMFCSVGSMFQKILGVPGNHPVLLGWNFWSVLVSPVRHFNAWRMGNQAAFQEEALPAAYEKLVHVPELTWRIKGIGIAFFLLLTVTVSFLCIRMAKKSYQGGDFGAKRLHQPFHDAWKGVLICTLCLLFFGTAGSVYLQAWVEKGYALLSTGPADISDNDILNFELVDVTAKDLTGRVSYQGIGIDYRGDFWKYSHYVIRPRMYAKAVAVGSILTGGAAAVSIILIRRRGRRKGKAS